MPRELEIWGGIECSLNRVGNDRFDQLEFTGHHQRQGDMEKVGRLGFQKIRYPILWETHEGNAFTEPDFSRVALHIQAIESSGAEVIATLLHHGCGPNHCPITDLSFPEMFAAYAGKVARRFPQFQYYIPINEPLTTARFSGIYGHWYPHGRCDKSFAGILVNQCKAIILSMREIRKVNPAAKLILSEDLCKVFSSPAMQYQADFENERRWLSYDLICGKMFPGHPLYAYLLSAGIAAAELDFFRANGERPFLAGFNYYPTSERYLDDDIESFPGCAVGTNGIHSYVDTEAIRVAHENSFGPEVLLREAFGRYGLPMALTEVHLHGTAEERLQWFLYLQRIAEKLRADRVPVKGSHSLGTVWLFWLGQPVANPAG